MQNSPPPISFALQTRVVGLYSPTGNCWEITRQQVASIESTPKFPGDFYITLHNGEIFLATNLFQTLTSNDGNNLTDEEAHAWIEAKGMVVRKHPDTGGGRRVG